MQVVIVESPAKAKTINKYLGPGYEVIASYGHVRDLPAKDGSVDPEHDFHMLWDVDPKAQKRLSDIARAVKGADGLILATDPDREGEAISWHVLEILKEKRALKDQPISRVVFNAITKQAVLEAMQHPRTIDAALVDAYLARRALDYLVGFTLSPVLWRKLPGARSAGRVQSVALRLVCDREREIETFVRREYWSIAATLATPRQETFEARLVGADGKKITRLDVGTEAEATDFRKALESADFKVRSVEAKPARRHPYPPFTTSTLQQEASRKLGLAPAMTMRIAQRLYEGVDVGGETVGLITYMRTDGVDMAPEAVAQARSVIGRDYGDRYVPSAPRKYTAKAKNAQEAHEAVRPTDLSRRPKDVSRHLEPEQAKLYELIWLRTVASQMESAELERTTVDIDAKAAGRALELRATGQVIKFDGFLTLYREGIDDGDEDEENRRLPAMSAGEAPGQQGHQGRPALHRAAAALFGSLAREAHGGARHRPSLHLRLRARRAARPRIRQARQAPPGARGQGPPRHGVPGELLRPLCRVRLHRRPGGEARPHLQWRARLEGRAARLLARLHRRRRRDQGTARLRRHLRARRDADRAHLPAQGRRVGSAPLPDLRHRAAVAEGRQVRRLHRLLELSGVQVHPPAGGAERRFRQPGGGQRHPRARHRPCERARSHRARRALRRLSAARRGQGRREAQALQPAQGPRAGGCGPGNGPRPAVAAARDRPAS